MVYVITAFLLISLVISIILNVRLYKAYADNETFLQDMEDDIVNDHEYFDKMCKTHLLMNDAFVVELIKRLRTTRDRFSSFAKEINNRKKI